MDRQARLIERIEAGWYDHAIETLFENAERECNYPVWKACNSRKDVAGLGPRRKIPKLGYTEAIVPQGIRCTVCAPRLRPYAEGLGKILKAIGVHHMDVGYRPAHIRAAKWMEFDALVTRVGTREHHVKLFCVEDRPYESPIYIIQTRYTDGQLLNEVEETYTSASRKFLQEVYDECVCADY